MVYFHCFLCVMYRGLTLWHRKTIHLIKKMINNIYPDPDREVTSDFDWVHKYVIEPDFWSGDRIGTSLLYKLIMQNVLPLCMIFFDLHQIYKLLLIISCPVNSWWSVIWLSHHCCEFVFKQEHRLFFTQWCLVQTNAMQN